MTIAGPELAALEDHLDQNLSVFLLFLEAEDYPAPTCLAHKSDLEEAKRQSQAADEAALSDTAEEFGRQMAHNELQRTHEIPSVDRVPQEIIDMIIDHVHSDKKFLSTLALVGRGWLRSARFHLFGFVKLYEIYCVPEGNEEEEDDDFRGWANSQLRVPAGLDIVRTSPEIASFIRSVELNAFDGGSIVRGCEFLSFLPNLRSVSFKNLNWLHFRYQHSIIKDILVSVAPRVECLSLYYTHFIDTADFLAFVAAFSNVRELSFTAVTWDGSHNSPSLPLPQPIFRDLPLQPREKVPRLTQLSFSMCTSNSIIMEMVTRPGAFVHELEKIKIQWEPELNVNSTNYLKYFDSVGPNLRALELVVATDAAVLQDPTPVVKLLSKCRQLSSFVIDISAWCQTDPWFLSIFEAVADASSSHLTEFIIRCSLHYDGRRNQFLPSATLDTVLSNRSRFPKRAKLSIMVVTVMREFGAMCRTNEQVEEIRCQELEKEFPKLSETGMLDVRRPPPRIL